VQARKLAAFAADNERLRGYYRERGFVELVRREFRDWGPVMLLEKPLIGRVRRTAVQSALPSANAKNPGGRRPPGLTRPCRTR
jgi:hypothetical protein